jgi:hypothetical protein
MSGTVSDPFNLTYPVGLKVNQIALIECLLWDAAVANSISVPAGYSTIANAFMNGVDGVAYGLFWKRLDGTETGNVSMDCTGPYTGGNDTFEAQMSIWDGCKTTGNPYEALTNQTGSSVNMQAAAVTTTGDYRLVCHFGGVVGQDTKTAATGTGYTVQWANNASTGLGRGTAFLHTKQVLNAAAEGAVTHTLNATSRWYESAFALLPVGA